MDKRAQACEKFRRHHATFVAAAKRMEAEANALARAKHLPVTTVSRAKTPHSFLKKIYFTKKNYTNPWAQTTDKVGVRVIVKYPNDLYPMVDSLLAAWGDRVVEHQDKSDLLGEDKLGYLGVHLQVVVPDMDTEGEPVHCEVQVRTAAQDLWSVTSHEILYKPDADLPKSTRRALTRLAALAEIFDEEVKRAMEQLLSDPSYPAAALAATAEGTFFAHATSGHNRSLSALLFEMLVKSIPETERLDYPDVLHTFVEEHASRIQELLDDAEQLHDPAMSLLTQPESLVLYERSESRPELLADLVHGEFAHLAWLVTPLLELWGHPLYEPT